MTTWSETEGSPQPPGATWLEKEKSYNFSLYSRHATDVTLLLYTAHDLVNPVLRVPLNHLIQGLYAAELFHAASELLGCFKRCGERGRVQGNGKSASSGRDGTNST